ncbi:hypothetical protein D3C78_886250 [compost metagenome]
MTNKNGNTQVKAKIPTIILSTTFQKGVMALLSTSFGLRLNTSITSIDSFLEYRVFFADLFHNRIRYKHHDKSND